MSGAACLDGGPAGSLADHTSLFDPVLLIGTLHRLGHRPAVLVTAGPWRVPLPARALTGEGYVTVQPGQPARPDALRHAADALTEGRGVLIHPEGGLPRNDAPHDRPPGRLRSGVVRLAPSSGASVIPIGPAGAHRVSSGSRAKQPAGWDGAPVRRPRVRAHIGADAGSDRSSVTFAHPGGSGSRPGPNELS
ncbi:lysophospholipid acyltransferase family protein [Streptomyces sp. NPDC001450]